MEAKLIVYLSLYSISLEVNVSAATVVHKVNYVKKVALSVGLK